jgi:hypothetical protein
MSALTFDADRAPLIAIDCHFYRSVLGFRPWFQWERSVGKTLPISVIACLHSTASHQHYVLIMGISRSTASRHRHRFLCFLAFPVEKLPQVGFSCQRTSTSDVLIDSCLTVVWLLILTYPQVHGPFRSIFPCARSSMFERKAG